MQQFSADVARLDRDGFVVLDGILPPAEVEQARQDLAKLFEEDVQSRKANGVTEPYRPGGPLGDTF